ncbi:TatD family hydrolase [Coprothermobacteraceae bacterium]|nr:TatD family hydrolase [Coprothermobacteraceae bacterium]
MALSPLPFYDSHSHLQDPAFEQDREVVLQSVRAELSSFVWVGYDLESSKRALDLRRVGEPVAVGLHPHYAHLSLDQFAYLEALYEHADAVGEAGLDTVRSRTSPEDQLKWFRRQIEAANYWGLPLIVHEREAFEPVMELLSECKTTVPVILHCFSHGPEEALFALHRGYYISFAGNLTYPKASNLRAALAVVPLDRLLLETDSPYLAPQRFRGKRSDPTMVKEIYTLAAELKGVSLDTLCYALESNFKAVFGV